MLGQIAMTLGAQLAIPFQTINAHIVKVPEKGEEKKACSKSLREGQLNHPFKIKKRLAYQVYTSLQHAIVIRKTAW